MADGFKLTAVAIVASLLVWDMRAAECAYAVISPVRIVAQEGVTNAACLLERRFGQVCEGKFLEGSGPVLEKGAWLLMDFGREFHGSVQIGSGAKSGKETSVRVRFGESVSEALTPLGEKCACNDHAIRDDVLSLPWMGRRVIGETGFRFVRIENVGGCPVQLDYVRAESIERPMEAVGSFRSSDERLNRIFDTAVRTVRLCCQDYLWDGIKRDRLVWLGDMHPEMMTVLAVFGDASVLTETLDYAMATTPPDEWMNRMPTYTLWWIRDLAEWYRFSGDAKRLARYGDYLEKTFDHVLTGFDAEGRWTAGTFLDWPTEHDKEAQTAGTQALALMAARETEFLAKALGQEPLAKKAGGMIARILRLKPDPNGEKSAAALLALSGLRDARTMYGSVLSRNGHEGVSTFYGYYMLEAMSAAGEHRRALDTVRDYWGAMLDVGATTFWEDFKLSWTNDCFRIDEMPVPGKKDVHGDYGEFCYKGFRHSLCHGWSCGPAAWCIRNVLGIRPLAVGCKTVEVRPFLGDLEWAEGAMALPGGGAVRVRVSKDGDGELVVDVAAPTGIQVLR